MRFPPAKYAIFDVDGTLLDSMGVWDAIDRDFLHEHGLAVPPGLDQVMKTLTLRQSAEYFRETFHLPESVPEIMDRFRGMVREEYEQKLPLKDGAAEYLAALARRGVQMGVATASEREHVDAALRRLGVREHFRFLLTCTELDTGKDRPDIFLEGARRFGAPPREVAVYEDALHALRTAKAAGFRTVAVYDPHIGAEWEQARALAGGCILHYREALASLQKEDPYNGD